MENNFFKQFFQPTSSDTSLDNYIDSKKEIKRFRDIKLLSEEDTEKLKRFFRKSSQDEEVNKFFNAHPLDDSFAEKICKKIGIEKDLYFIHETEGKINGYAALRGWDENWPDPGLSMFVDSEQRNRGVGESLIAFAAKKAKEAGAEKIVLGVAKDNIPAQNLYYKVGFKTDYEYVSEINGRPHYFCHLDLKEEKMEEN